MSGRHYTVDRVGKLCAVLSTWSSLPVQELADSMGTTAAAIRGPLAAASRAGLVERGGTGWAATARGHSRAEAWYAQKDSEEQWTEQTYIPAADVTPEHLDALEAMSEDGWLLLECGCMARGRQCESR